MSLAYLAIERDIHVHNRESKVLLSCNISSVRVDSMNEGIERAVGSRFLFIVINADNINYISKLSLLRETTEAPILIATTSYTMQEHGRATCLGADFFGQISDNPNDNLKSVMAFVSRFNERGSRQGESANVIRYGDILIAPDYFKVYSGDHEVALSKTEFNILLYLISSRGRVLSHKQIYHHIWDYGYEESSHEIIKSAIKRLRKKLDSDGQCHSIIENVKGVGFRIPMISS